MYLSSSNVTSLLLDLGWGSGFRIPVASNQNAKLEKLLEKRQKELLEVKGHLEEAKKGKEILDKQITITQNEIKDSKDIIQAKRSTVCTEKQLCQLEVRQLDKMIADSSSTCQNLEDLYNKNITMKCENGRREKIIGEISELVALDKEILKEYRKSTESVENEINFIKKFSEMDEKLIEEFEKKFAHLGEILSSSKLKLDQNLNTTLSLEKQLERVLWQFRRIHKERSDIVFLWKNTTESIKSRDQEVNQMSQKYSKLTTTLNNLQDNLKMKKRLLETSVRNTTEVDSRVQKTDRLLAELAVKLSAEKNVYESTSCQLSSYTHAIRHDSEEIEKLGKKCQKIDENIRKFEQDGEKIEEEIKIYQDHWTESLTLTFCHESQVTEFESMLQRSEVINDGLQREMDKFRRFIWQKSQEMNELKKSEENYSCEIKSKMKLIEKYTKTEHDYLKKFEELQSTLFMSELKYLEIRRRLRDLECPYLEDPEKAGILRMGIDALELDLRKILSDRQYMESSLEHLNEIIERLSRDIKEEKNDQIDLKINLKNTRWDKNVVVDEEKKVTEEYKDLLVDNSLTQLLLKQIQKRSKGRRKEISSLEKERETLLRVVSDRRGEIKCHINLLICSRKNLRDEKSSLLSQLSELQMDLQVKKKKYEIVKYAFNVGEDGEVNGQDESEAYFIVKHAQEKELVRREGDLWDSRVREAEKELSALENTHSLIMGSNANFRESLQPASSNTLEGKEFEELERTRREFEFRIRKFQKIIEGLILELKDKFGRIEFILAEISVCEGELGDRAYELNGLLLEVAGGRTKIQRAANMASRVTRQLGHQSDDEKNFVQADLKVRGIREKYQFGVNTLEKSIVSHQEMKNFAIEWLKENGSSVECQDLAKKLGQLCVHGQFGQYGPRSTSAMSLSSGSEGSSRSSGSSTISAHSRSVHSKIQNKLNFQQKRAISLPGPPDDPFADLSRIPLKYQGQLKVKRQSKSAVASSSSNRSNASIGSYLTTRSPLSMQTSSKDLSRSSSKTTKLIFPRPKSENTNNSSSGVYTITRTLSRNGHGHGGESDPFEMTLF